MSLLSVWLNPSCLLFCSGRALCRVPLCASCWRSRGMRIPCVLRSGPASTARTTRLSGDSCFSACPLCMSKAWNIILVTVKGPANSNLLSSFHQITSSSSMSARCHNFLLSTLNIIHSQLHWRPITHLLILHHEECSKPQHPG